MKAEVHKVVIVGGGAGGLELAAKLGRKFGPRYVYLVDRVGNHIWKPSLHEVAAGTLDIHREGLSYAMLAKDCGFTFILGEMAKVDREAKLIQLEPVVVDQHIEVFPARDFSYDTLVLAVGSKSNFFGTPGAAEFAIALDSTEEAERFRLRLLRELVIANRRKEEGAGRVLNIGIVGGGATGVELAAELLEACAGAVYYGLDSLDLDKDIQITLLEGSDRILSALPEKMSTTALRLLQDRGVNVQTSVRVAKVEADALYDAQGKQYYADLCVWAAGIKAPDFLTGLGLDTNRINQLVVDGGLRSSDPAVFAMGDCAQVPSTSANGTSFFPASAQVAHQQAGFLLPILAGRIHGKEVGERLFTFRDSGSLISVGHRRGVGSLVGVLSRKSWFVEGLLARTMYMSLHLMHHMAVLGFGRAGALALGRLFGKRGAPRIKLH